MASLSGNRGPRAALSARSFCIASPRFRPGLFFSRIANIVGAVLSRSGRAASERVEHIAARISGALLFALAAFIVLAAAWSLWTRHAQEFSLSGFIIAALAIPSMTLLARRKIALADQLGSRAMRADAVESITCGWLSLVVVVGLVADWLIGVWWIDAVTSLGIVWFIAKEAREAWAGDDCCDH